MSEITIYHTNDMHNNRHSINFLEKIKKNKQMLILDSGDAIAGSNTVFRLSEEILLEMGRVGYDAMAMGNREFNYSRWVLKRRKDEANFPILCANLEDLADCGDESYIPSIVGDVDGVKIGIFGLTPVQYRDSSKWLPVMKFRFLDPIETSEKILKNLKERADVIILLSHLGVEKDKEIARNMRGIDFIIGGHSHTLIEKPLLINNTYIFQAGSHGKHIGKITFEATAGSLPTVKNLKYELIRNG